MSVFYLMMEGHLSHVRAIANWLLKTAEAVEADVPALKQAAGAGGSGGCQTYKFHSGLKSGLTSLDRDALKPALKKLFDSCQKANIAVELAGFDLLPRTGLVSPGSISFITGPGDFLVSVDAGREFNFATNPFSGQAVVEEKNKDAAVPPSQPKFEI